MKTYRYILLMVALLVTLGTQAQRYFYDSKSNLTGVSGDYDQLLEGLDTRKYMQNKIGGELPFVKDANGKKFNGQATADALNKAGVGKRVLDYLFQRSTGRLSDDLLKSRAMLNAQLADRERAEAGLIDANTILRDDYLPILENNYVFLTFRPYSSKKLSWVVLHVDITKETLDDVYRCWSDLAAYDKLQVSVSYVTQGRTKTRPDVKKVLRSVSKKVAPMAIRGQVVGSSPTMADVGLPDGVKNQDRMFIYRQHERRNGERYSTKIGTARVTKFVSGESKLNMLSGLSPSYKKADMAVFHPDRRVAFDFTAHHEDNYNALNVNIDHTRHMGSSGLMTHGLFRFGAGIYDKTDTELYLHNGKLYRSPVNLHAALGLGFGHMVLNRIEVMPYAMVQFSYLLAAVKSPRNGDDSNSTDDKELGDPTFWQYPVGVKLNINLKYPVQLIVGGEYLFGRERNSNMSDFTDKFMYLSGNKCGGRMNFYGGLRFNF